MKCFYGATVALLCMLSATTGLAQGKGSQFDAPQIIRVGDKPMNDDGQIMYPSPVLFDIDGDGKNELVLGSIFGDLFACENTNEGKGDPTWDKPVAVENVDNVPLKLNNW